MKFDIKGSITTTRPMLGNYGISSSTMFFDETVEAESKTSAITKLLENKELGEATHISLDIVIHNCVHDPTSAK